MHCILRAPTVIFALTLAPLPAVAMEWLVDKDQTRLTFTADQFGQKFTGTFGAYKARIQFDPNDLSVTRVAVDVDVSAIKTGDPQRDTSIMGLEWFAEAGHPVARFEAQNARRVGGTRYALDGTLTIKGISEEATLEFDLETDGAHANVQGTMTVLRSTYEIGEGQFSAPQVAANEVIVHVDLVATAVD